MIIYAYTVVLMTRGADIESRRQLRLLSVRIRRTCSNLKRSFLNSCSSINKSFLKEILVKLTRTTCFCLCHFHCSMLLRANPASHFVLFLLYFMLAITVRDKLESLCRELQRQNKMLMVCILLFFFFLLYFVCVIECLVLLLFLCITGRMQAGFD